jgi:hypothetical protein
MKTAAILAGLNVAMAAEITGIERMVAAAVPVDVTMRYAAADDATRRRMLIEIGRSGPPRWLQLSVPSIPASNPSGGRYHSLLSWDQEVDQVRSWGIRADQGEPITVAVMRSELSAMTKGDVSGRTIGRLLTRHGYCYVPCRSQCERQQRNRARHLRMAA